MASAQGLRIIVVRSLDAKRPEPPRATSVELVWCGAPGGELCDGQGRIGVTIHVHKLRFREPSGLGVFTPYPDVFYNAGGGPIASPFFRGSPSCRCERVLLSSCRSNRSH